MSTEIKIGLAVAVALWCAALVLAVYFHRRLS